MSECIPVASRRGGTVRARVGAVICGLAMLWPAGQCATQGSILRITQVDRSRFPTVRVYLSLTGAAGQPVSGLTRDLIRLSEGGKAAPLVEFKGLKDEPVTAFLAIDQSGSMKGEKIQSAKRAAAQFVSLMRPQDRVGLVGFSDEPLVLSNLSSDQAELSRHIRKIRADGATAFYRALHSCLDGLAAVPGRKSIVVLTDGHDTDVPKRMNRRQTAEFQEGREAKVIAATVGQGVPVYTIGLGNDVNRQALQRIAAETHGTYRFAPSAGELARLFTDIAKQIQHEVLAEYESPNPDLDGTLRKVTVTARVEGEDLTAAHTYLVSGVMPFRVRAVSGPEGRRGDPFVVYLALIAVFAALALAPGLKARLAPATSAAETRPETLPKPQPGKEPGGRVRILSSETPPERSGDAHQTDNGQPGPGRIRILPRDGDEGQG